MSVSSLYKSQLTNAFIAVDGELPLEHIVALVVVEFPVRIGLLSLVYRAEFTFQTIRVISLEGVRSFDPTIPNGDIVLLHEGNLSIVHPSNVLFLFRMTLESADSIRESKTAVVVNRVHRVREDLVEAGEVHAETGGEGQRGCPSNKGLLTPCYLRIAFEEEDVLGVDIADGGDDAVVKAQQAGPF